MIEPVRFRLSCDFPSQALPDRPCGYSYVTSAETARDARMQASQAGWGYGPRRESEEGHMPLRKFDACWVHRNEVRDDD